MANQHYTVNSNNEIEITIKLKAKITSISNYHHLNDFDKDLIIDEFKENIKNEIESNIDTDVYNSEVCSCDYINYTIEIL